MSRITENHEDRSDHIVTQEESGGELISLFVVSEHLTDNSQTQVAEIWLGRENVSTLVSELQQWLKSSSQKTHDPRTV